MVYTPPASSDNCSPEVSAFTSTFTSESLQVSDVAVPASNLSPLVSRCPRSGAAAAASADEFFTDDETGSLELTSILTLSVKLN